MIRVVNIEKSYGTLKVLKGINLEVKKGEVVCIVGASGAGKTTLLNIIGTLEKGNSGSVYFNENDVAAYTDKKIASFRNTHVGFVFQFHHLLPEFTALENVCLPAFIAGIKRNDAEEKAKSLLQLLGLNERMHHKPNQLSGGEQQRVAVARALVNNPDVILADEPSGNLDSQNARELHSLFFHLRDKFQQTFIIVTHNEELAGMADRKIVIRDGIIA